MADGIDKGSPVAVVGAGTMGAGIAQLVAAAGHRVYLFDSEDGAVERAVSGLKERLESSVARGRRSAEEVEALLGNIVSCGWLAQCAPAGLIIEAVVEDIDVKRAVLADIEALAEPDAVIATNTSSLSVTAIGSGLSNPRRFVGMHFFNPAPVMPLVEIISGAETAPDAARSAATIVASWGKVPVHCLSTPGFIVNRIVRPFYGEAVRLAAGGAADYATIDAVMTGSGGFRMGPFAMMDLIGLDINLAVSESVFAQSFHDTRFAPHVLERSLVDAGLLGQKTGRGFFEYGAGAPSPVAVTIAGQPAPVNVEAHGDLGWAAGLVGRLLDAGVEVDGVDGGGPGHFIFDGLHLMPTDGRTATELAAAQVLGTNNVAVFDLVRDWDDVDHVGIAVADQADPGKIERAAALFQAIGCEVSLLDDTHGLVVMRTVAQLAAVAADAVADGVAAAADIDTAMCLGTSFPLGPLEWADRIGLAHMVRVLNNLHHGFGEDRYRVPPLLARRAATGGSLREGKA